MLKEGIVRTRSAGVRVGRELVRLKFIHHVTDAREWTARRTPHAARNTPHMARVGNAACARRPVLPSTAHGQGGRDAMECDAMEWPHRVLWLRALLPSDTTVGARAARDASSGACMCCCLTPGPPFPAPVA